MNEGAGSVIAVLALVGFACAGAFHFVRVIVKSIKERLALLKEYRFLRQIADELTTALETNFGEAVDALRKFDTKEADRLLARRIEIATEFALRADVH